MKKTEKDQFDVEMSARAFSLWITFAVLSGFVVGLLL